MSNFSSKRTSEDMSVIVIHQIFADCKNYNLDPYWKEKFDKFSKNKFPSGVRYDSNHQNLVLKLDGKKSEIIALPVDDAAHTFQIVMKVLQEKLNMRSNRDVKLQKEEMDEFRSQNTCDLDCEWKKIKPKHLKDQLIMDYIAKLKEKHNLNDSEVKNLVSIVQIGFQFRSLSQDDVEFVNGIIKTINNLEFDEENRKFITPEYGSVAKVMEKNTNVNKFYTGMKKFIRDNNLRVTKFKA